jgi:branched-chain amino acid transport system ATP-binding protein
VVRFPEASPAGGAVALAVSDLSVTYGDFVAVERASFQVAEGECVAIVGPNGNGKSSIAMAVAGLADRRGVVRLFGQVAPARDPMWMVSRGLALVPERRQLFPNLSVLDNIALGCYAWTRSLRTALRSEALSEALEFFPQLRPRLRQKAGTLSGGEQQMVALARGMASRPRVLVIDEPCLGLAEAVARRLYGVLAAMNRQGRTIVLVEENPVRALELSHQVVRVQNGVTVGVEAPPRRDRDPGA